PVIAAATARRIDPPPVEGTGDRAGLAPAMLAAIARAEELLGREIPITSGYRSIEHQQRLWDNRHSNPYPVARPGRSRHQQGLAIDVPSWFVPTLESVSRDSGLCNPIPGDPIHFQLCGT
ncbi:MAG: M15 family metallopeptidase, partial [Actinomycetota bacterium]